MKDNEYIKFDYIVKKSVPLKKRSVQELDKYRDLLYKKKLIGINKKGIGFGNISCRYNKNKFIITGNATGGIINLKPQHYALVLNWNFKENKVVYSGKTSPSSESLSHAIIYESDPSIKVVVHIHNNQLWSRFKNKISATPSNISYGTPEMANAIKRILKKKTISNKGILRMGGHRGGFMLFGKNFQDIYENLKSYLK